MLWREGLLGFTTTIQCSAELYYLPCCSALQYRSAAYRSSTLKAHSSIIKEGSNEACLTKSNNNAPCVGKRQEETSLFAGKSMSTDKKWSRFHDISLIHSQWWCSITSSLPKGAQHTSRQTLYSPMAHFTPGDVLMKTTQRRRRTKKYTWSSLFKNCSQSFSPLL